MLPALLLLALLAPEPQPLKVKDAPAEDVLSVDGAGKSTFRPRPVTTLRADACTAETLHVALLAVAGARTGLVQIDPPPVSLLDGEDHERAVRERNARVRQLVQIVLTACAKEASKPAEKEPAK